MVPTRYTDKACPRCKGAGFGNWRPNAGRCWGCSNGKAEARRQWFGCTVFARGRTFKLCVKAYDAQAALCDASSELLFQVDSAERIQQFRTGEQAPDTTGSWVHGVAVKAVRITLAQVQELDRKYGTDKLEVVDGKVGRIRR